MVEKSVAETNKKDTYYLMSYITNGTEYYASYDNRSEPVIGNSLHLAVSVDGGKTYEPLNFNIGVLYAEADYSDEASDTLYGDAKMFRSPYLFRMLDGGYGVITAKADADSDSDSTDGMVMIYKSEDLKSYVFMGYLKVDNAAVYEPMCAFENGVYVMSWTNKPGGERKCAETENFKTIKNVKASEKKYPEYEISTDFAENITNILEISKSEYGMIRQKLNASEIVSVRAFDDIKVKAGGEAVLPKKATAVYNDGSEQEFDVRWDAEKLDTSRAGVYTIYGELTEKEYPSDFIANRADPCILKDGNNYYFAATRDSGGQNVLNIRAAKSIDGLADAEEYTLYENRAGLIWAPEIHNIDGRLMIFFADGSGDWSTVQCSVMVLRDGGDALNASDWSMPVRIKQKDGRSNITDDGISLDMTCFKWKEKWYLAWSQRRVNSGNENIHESANIYIAEYNPDNPEKLAGNMHVISRPLFGWERSHVAVDEGPFALIHGGRLYMTIAVNGTDYSYGIKLMTLKENGNPLNAGDWETQGYPLLASAMNGGEPGPGHSSFVQGESGDIFLVYHWGKEGTGRTTTAKRVHFRSDGTPEIDIPRDADICGKTTVKVIVED